MEMPEVGVGENDVRGCVQNLKENSVSHDSEVGGVTNGQRNAPAATDAQTKETVESKRREDSPLLRTQGSRGPEESVKSSESENSEHESAIHGIESRDPPAAGQTTSRKTPAHNNSRGRFRYSKNPPTLDKYFLSQIRCVINCDWEDKGEQEMQGYTAENLRKLSKSLQYYKHSGVKKHVSTSGPKSLLIGRILAWQKARESDRREVRTEIQGETGCRYSNERFHVDDSARLILVMVDSDTFAAVARIYEPAGRQEIDASRGPLTRSSWKEIAERYNDEGFEPENAFHDNVQLSVIDPRFPRVPRSGDCLKSQMAKLRSQYKICYTNWTKSGQNDPDTFYDFCQGESIMLFMFHTLQECPLIKEYLTRTLPEGLSVNTESEYNGSGDPVEMLRRVKRRRRSEPATSSMASTLEVQADGLVEAIRESTNLKLEARKSLDYA